MDKTTRGDWREVRRVFEDSLLQPAEGRLQHARELCGSDSVLWDEVKSLLEWHESSDSFLETPAVEQVVERGPARNQLIPGQQISHYEITKLIGEGGMGEVYLARDKRLHRNVAIKLLRGDLLPHARGSERLLREARAVALLEHPNICHVYEISESDGFNFIVMQYVVGTTLDEILATANLNASTVLDLAAQIADGLAEAHSQGIIHRDIKPANIIISNKGQAKILDFGLAKAVEGEMAADGVSRLESWGGIMGTIPYMSPEQLSGRAADARTDVFSFGSLLFEMISGAPAFRRERNEDTISAILSEQPDWSIISPPMRPLLEGCLAKDPADRYASAGEIVKSLEAARRQMKTHAVRAQPSTSKRERFPTDQSEVRTAIHSMSTQALDLERTTGPSAGSDERARRSAEGKFQTWNGYLFGNDLRKILTGAAAAIVFSAGVFAYLVYSTSDPISKDTGSTDAPQRLYWELSSTNRRRFIQNRLLQIQTLIGDDQRGISDESLDGIYKEVDRYVSRRDSLSQEPFKEGLRSVYGRASQYAPLISAEFDKAKVPTAIGIYQAMVESEYRDCLVNENGPTGIFQFTKATAERFGLAAKDRCRVDVSAKAAAAYESKLRISLGNEGSSWTLTLLSFNQGEEATRRQLEKLVELGSTERSYWAISENQKSLADFNPDSDQYLRRFFAAAIIGENPEMFGLVTPPLSTIRTRADLGIQSDVNPLIAIPGGSFNMGRGINDGHFDFERPQHLESVDGFRMNKTEVTNEEFADFIAATGYNPDGDKSKFLAHWVNGLPLEDDAHKPVRFVNLEDINAFIKWKSQIEGIQYRLPTEKEWEYAARNGSRNNIYPWGDKFDPRCANINRTRSEPVAVGTHSCPNVWGIQDLIGNVFEWTATPARPYPGSRVEIAPVGEEQFIIRGGGAFENVFETSMGPNAITSTFRYPVIASRRASGLGFRLVTSQ